MDCDDDLIQYPAYGIFVPSSQAPSRVPLPGARTFKIPDYQMLFLQGKIEIDGEGLEGDEPSQPPMSPKGIEYVNVVLISRLFNRNKI